MSTKPYDTSSTLDHTWTVPTDVIASKVGDVMVVVCLRRNRIFELNPTGARIWELLSEGRIGADIVSALGDEFDVEPTTAAEELLELTRQLRDENLIEAHGAR